MHNTIEPIDQDDFFDFLRMAELAQDPSMITSSVSEQQTDIDSDALQAPFSPFNPGKPGSGSGILL